MSAGSNLQPIDHNVIRTNQFSMMTLLLLAFLLDFGPLALVAGLIALAAALYPPLGLYTLLYRRVVLPLGILKPDVHEDHREPHRFAQTVGGSLSTLGGLLVIAGVPLVGWVLALMVSALAALNVFAGWCAGCTMYYWFNRLGVPGFERSRGELAG